MRRKLATIGDRDVLVIRVVGTDASTTASEAQLSDDVFGNDRDPVNLRNQFAACSYGQLIFIKATDDVLIDDDGVYTVNINTTVNGKDIGVIEAAAIQQAKTDFGVTRLDLIAKHIMLCIPPGTTPSWVARAYENKGLYTVYNDV